MSMVIVLKSLNNSLNFKSFWLWAKTIFPAFFWCKHWCLPRLVWGVKAVTRLAWRSFHRSLLQGRLFMSVGRWTSFPGGTEVWERIWTRLKVKREECRKDLEEKLVRRSWYYANECLAMIFEQNIFDV